MKLRDFFAMLTDPNEIEQIFAKTPDGKTTHRFCYNDFETPEEYIEWMLDPMFGEDPTEEELKVWYNEYVAYLKHLDAEIIKVDICHRIVWVKTVE